MQNKVTLIISIVTTLHCDYKYFFFSLATCFVILDDIPELCSSIRRRLFEATDYVLCVESFRQQERTGMFKVLTFLAK